MQSLETASACLRNYILFTEESKREQRFTFKNPRIVECSSSCSLHYFPAFHRFRLAPCLPPNHKSTLNPSKQFFANWYVCMFLAKYDIF